MVRVVVMWADRPNDNVHLMDNTLTSSVQTILQHLFEKWEIPEVEKRNFQLNKPADGELEITKPNCAKQKLTDEILSELKDGAVLHLTHTAHHEARKCVQRLESGSRSELESCLLYLLERVRQSGKPGASGSDVIKERARVKCPDLAAELVGLGAHEKLIQLISSETFSGTATGTYLLIFISKFVKFAFSSADTSGPVEGLFSWQLVDQGFVQGVVNCIGGTLTADTEALRPGLKILELFAQNNSDRVSYLSGLSCQKLVSFIRDLLKQMGASAGLAPHSIGIVQQRKRTRTISSALVLIIELLRLADRDKSIRMIKELNDKNMISVFNDCYLLYRSVTTVDKDYKALLRNLTLLQHYLLQPIAVMAKTAVDPSKEEDDTSLRELRLEITNESTQRTSTSMDRESKPLFNRTLSTMETEGFSKLGFTNPKAPWDDLLGTPPGSLALKCLEYVCLNDSENFRKMTMEKGASKEHVFPMARAGVELSLILLRLLDVSVEYRSSRQEMDVPARSIHPMLFTHEYPFQETFCVCLRRFARTWREMRAVADDMTTVRRVVEDQVDRALSKKCDTLQDFEKELDRLGHGAIKGLWKEEWSNREREEENSSRVHRLRERLTPDLEALIARQRLRHLESGATFKLRSGMGGTIKKGKQSIYLKLSHNHKVFHYCVFDTPDQKRAEPPTLNKNLQVCDISNVKIGTDVGHDKSLLKTTKSIHEQKYFVIEVAREDAEENEKKMEFFCICEEQGNVYDIWIDGLNALKGKHLFSRLFRDHLEDLFKLETRVRLLDLEGIDIPERAPPVPPLPDNFDFCLEA